MSEKVEPFFPSKSWNNLKRRTGWLIKAFAQRISEKRILTRGQPNPGTSITSTGHDRLLLRMIASSVQRTLHIHDSSSHSVHVGYLKHLLE